MPNENDPNADFRQRLFTAQGMTPGLREGYRKELDAILYETQSPRSRLLGITLLVICLAIVAGEIYALFHYRNQGATFYTGAITMLAVCAYGTAWIARDLVLGRSLRKRSLKFPELFYGAASILLVVTMLKGLQSPSDPASTFNVLFLFVFFAVCTNWAFSARISAAELTLREETLRIECRLAELAERLARTDKTET